MSPFSLRRRQEPLQKIQAELAQHLRIMRHVAPESADFLARRMFTDTLVPEVGNKLAWDDFQSRPRKGGVHVMIDGNSLGPLNKIHGQSAGDTAIRAMFGALSKSSRVFRGKIFRVGGDEGRAYFEKPEHAYAFAREVRKQLEAIPPIKGQHHLSVSIGFASSPEEAEQALIHAKNAKKAAGYAVGHEQTHAHSLLPGAEGPVNVAPPSPFPEELKPPVAGEVKNEDKETAELKVQKREMDLAELAVLHDDPRRPMKLWQFQNNVGRTPVSLRKSEADMWGDGPQRLAYISSRDAVAHFSQQEISELRHAGFALRQVWATKVWRLSDESRVAYLPAGPSLKSVK